MTNIISWIATGFCIAGNIWVIRKNKIGFLIWFIGTGTQIYLAWIRFDYAQVTMFTIYNIINIVGYIEWNRMEKKGQIR